MRAGRTGPAAGKAVAAGTAAAGVAARRAVAAAAVAPQEAAVAAAAVAAGQPEAVAEPVRLKVALGSSVASSEPWVVRAYMRRPAAPGRCNGRAGTFHDAHHVRCGIHGPLPPHTIPVVRPVT